jgi:hypothetical protein
MCCSLRVPCVRLVALLSCAWPIAARADVTVDRGTQYQTFDAWEATGYAGQDHAAFASFRDLVMTMAATELGITRLRLEVRAGVENDVDYYQQFQGGSIDNATWRGRRYTNVNDNADPDVIEPAGFHFTELDESVGEIVIPLRNAVEAAGGTFEVNLCYVAFTGQNAMGTQYIHDQASEYGELVQATYEHLQSVHGFVPDYWEMILEPDNTTQWTGMVIGRAMVEVGARIEALGHTPRLIAPSNTNMTAARNFFDALAMVPGALDHLAVLSYHRYGGTGASVAQDMADRAEAHGIKTAMLEWIGAGADELHEDLKVAHNSSWQQFTLASPYPGDDGGAYLRVDASDPDNPVVTLGSRSRLLRQYMKYIRPGAVRIAASSDDAVFDPVAFLDPRGTDVVVVKATAGGSFAVHGLAAGDYDAVYTTDDETAVSTGPLSLADGAALDVSIPAAGVVTIYGRPPSGDPDDPIDAGPSAGSGGNDGSTAGEDGGGRGGANASGAGADGGAAQAGSASAGRSGSLPPVQAGSGADAEATAGDGDADSGCGCHLVGRPRSPAPALVCLALFVAISRRVSRTRSGIKTAWSEP